MQEDLFGLTIESMQATVLRLQQQCDNLSEQIDRLPPCSTRTSLRTKYEKLLFDMSTLQGAILTKDIHACVYGLKTKCGEGTKGGTTCRICLDEYGV